MSASNSSLTNQVWIGFRCDFCPLTFMTLSENNAHILSHFEQQVCGKCKLNLVRIGSAWYVHHDTVACSHESIQNAPTENEQDISLPRNELNKENIDLTTNQIATDEFQQTCVQLEYIELKQELCVESESEELNIVPNEYNGTLNEVYIKVEDTDVNGVCENESEELKNGSVDGPGVINTHEEVKERRTRKANRLPVQLERGTRKAVQQSVNVHQCEICSKTFSRKDNLYKHNLIVHAPSSKAYKCKECEQSFIERFQFEHHNRRNCICNGCGDTFCAKSSLKSHQEKFCELKTNENVGMRRCKHFGCMDSVAANKWIEHMSMKHSDYYKIFVCDMCHKACPTKTAIRNHILTIHCPTSKKFKCDSCDFSCISDAILKQHKRFIHNKVYNFMCSDCGKTFRTQYRLLLHSYMHSDAKPFECTFDGCSKRFRSQTSRKGHMYVHTGKKPYPCTVTGCDREFASFSGLKLHKFNVHGIYNKKYTCQVCLKNYVESVAFKRHMKKHEIQR